MSAVIGTVRANAPHGGVSCFGVEAISHSLFIVTEWISRPTGQIVAQKLSRRPRKSLIGPEIQMSCWTHLQLQLPCPFTSDRRSKRSAPTNLSCGDRGSAAKVFDFNGRKLVSLTFSISRSCPLVSIPARPVCESVKFANVSVAFLMPGTLHASAATHSGSSGLPTMRACLLGWAEWRSELSF